MLGGPKERERTQKAFVGKVEFEMHQRRKMEFESIFTGQKGNDILEWDESIRWSSRLGKFKNVQETVNSSVLLKQNKCVGGEAMIWQSLTVRVRNLVINYEEGGIGGWFEVLGW